MTRQTMVRRLGPRRHLAPACFLGLYLIAGWSAQSAVAQVTTRFAIETPMRDGIKLISDLWLPEGPGPHPTILVRTPYERTMELVPENRPPLIGDFFARRGYAWMIQDTRGRGDSEGTFRFFADDGPDGFDTIEWIAKQPWSNGRVCMMGVSYLGTVQWLAAKERPPHLVCIAPTAAAGRWFDELPYLGGALQVGFMLGWTYRTAGRTYAGGNATLLDWEAIARHRPLATMDQAVGRTIPAWQDFLAHPTFDDYWRKISYTEDDFRLDLPALHITGWFDWDQPGALFYWRGMQRHSPAADHQYLVVGPWTHPQTWTGGNITLGEWRFAGSSVFDLKPIHLAFFDRYLKRSTDRLALPRARVYLTGTNEWRDIPSYPAPGVARQRWHLRSGGKANSLGGDGRLTLEAPGTEPPDRYDYDPRRPVPSTIGSADPRGIDHRAIERRDDVLVYTTDELTAPLVIGGPVTVTLRAATDGRDTDFTAKILDVHPDGRALKLGPTEVGVRRARYRNGAERLDLVTPGAVEEYRIDLFDIGHVFQAGHRIRLEISSSAFPFIDPNTNTGNPAATDTESRVAQQTVYHDRGRLSWVELPIWR